MAQPTSTKKSSAPFSLEPASPLPGLVDFHLDLPDGRHFDSELPRMDLDAFIGFCEQLLPTLRSRPDFWERRAADRCPAEFDLLDPTRVPVTYPAKFIDELLSRPPSRL